MVTLNVCHVSSLNYTAWYYEVLAKYELSFWIHRYSRYGLLIVCYQNCVHDWCLQPDGSAIHQSVVCWWSGVYYSLVLLWGHLFQQPLSQPGQFNSCVQAWQSDWPIMFWISSLNPVECRLQLTRRSGTEQCGPGFSCLIKARCFEAELGRLLKI